MEIISLTAKNRAMALERAAEFLASSKTVVCPTDTVYGLLASAMDPKTVKKVYAQKKREPGKPLPVFIKSIEAARLIAEISESDQKKLMAAWPGKTTFVLNLKSGANLAAVQGKTIALRMPGHEFLLDLLKNVAFPVIGTSANLAGLGPFVKINDVLDQFKNSNNPPDLVIDAGDLPESKPSTIIDLTDNAKILRK